MYWNFQTKQSSYSFVQVSEPQTFMTVLIELKLLMQRSCRHMLASHGMAQGQLQGQSIQDLSQKMQHWRRSFFKVLLLLYPVNYHATKSCCVCPAINPSSQSLSLRLSMSSSSCNHYQNM